MVQQKKKGFTLIELLVVISIIALLIAILLPALSAARKTAMTAKCQSNLKQIATGLFAYLNFNEQAYPHPVDLAGASDYLGATVNMEFIGFTSYNAGSYAWESGLLAPYVNNNRDVCKCPNFWTGMWRNPNPHGMFMGTVTGPAISIMDECFSYGINWALHGNCQWDGTNTRDTVYEYDVRRPSTCTMFADSWNHEAYGGSALKPPQWAWDVVYGPAGWLNPATQYGTDDVAGLWSGSQPGLRHDRKNYGFNDVFCDGHAENVTAWSHYDFLGYDNTYWDLDP